MGINIQSSIIFAWNHIDSMFVYCGNDDAIDKNLIINLVEFDNNSEVKLNNF